ncbi:phosphatase PAP2 family protein [Halomarina litorea]|uniref:phosphatase PAP2 family protein n=1 Tax=Halomarina litorea TaxID=2961595 RepID=UPI0020C53BF2|nr:phosphatase PAP2 family protein [Halomarina sp. BCD28]
MTLFQSSPIPERGVDVVDALQSLLGDPLFVVFALVTQLGDPWFYFVVLTGLYLVADDVAPLDRRRAAFLVALALGVVALTSTLKGYFGLPRPPVPEVVPGIEVVPPALHPLYLSVATADGFAFPSGHALGTAAIWGGVALVLRVSTLPRRLLAAALVAGLVALSRLVLGVHYLVDVLAGAVVGAAFLAVVYLLAERGERPKRAFALAVALAVVSVVTRGLTFETAAALGATTGGMVAWHYADDHVVGRRLTRREWAIGATMLGTLGVGFAVLYTYLPSPAVAFVGGVLVVVGVLMTPLLADEADEPDGREANVGV